MRIGRSGVHDVRRNAYLTAMSGQKINQIKPGQPITLNLLNRPIPDGRKMPEPVI